jgi:PilZ domain
MSDEPRSQSEPPPSNRRREPRSLSCIPAYVENQDTSKHLALIRDISATGARLLVQEQWRVGEPVRLSLYLSADPNAARSASGKVVRAERHEGAREIWGYQIAVDFDESIGQYAAEINALTEQQEKLGLFK